MLGLREGDNDRGAFWMLCKNSPTLVPRRRFFGDSDRAATRSRCRNLSPRLHERFLERQAGAFSSAQLSLGVPGDGLLLAGFGTSEPTLAPLLVVILPYEPPRCLSLSGCLLLHITGANARGALRISYYQYAT